MVPLQLSLAVTPLNTFGTAAWQLPSALALLGAGQLTVGTVVSVTVKAAQLVTLPHVPVTCTQYSPASVEERFGIESELLVAPATGEPPLIH